MISEFSFFTFISIYMYVFLTHFLFVYCMFLKQTLIIIYNNYNYIIIIYITLNEDMLKKIPI